MIHFEDTWKSFDGLDIFVQGWKPETDTAKAVVCLVHGLGEHSARYSHVAEALVKSGYILFGADIRGHGRSSGLRGHTPSDDAILKDIDLLLENAQKRFPKIPILLYGNSLGGIFVLYYGLKRKPAIKGIIATSAAMHTALENQPAKILASKILGSLVPKLSMPSGLDTNALSQDPKVLQEYVNDPLVHDKVTVGFGKIVLSMSRYILLHDAELSVPILLMHGKEDAIAFPSGSIEVAAQLPEKSKLVLFEGARHELHNEPVKNEVSKTMINWLNNRIEDRT